MIPTTEKKIEIRDVTTVEEMRVVEELQKEVWQVPDIEVVPYSHMIATVTAGGVLIGAFDGEEMVGFVYGFPSFERGEAAHHSHMLAVKPAYRNYKLGEKLKLAQRDAVAKHGIHLISWTFDPLQSLNAYFNFNKLGVTSSSYYVNFYGEDAPSFLHQNGTDRLWVFWDQERESRAPTADAGNIPRLVQMGAGETPEANEIDEISGNAAAIEIPANINELQKRDMALAIRWREATRQAFVSAFDAGFVADGFQRGNRNTNDYGVYILNRKG